MGHASDLAKSSENVTDAKLGRSRADSASKRKDIEWLNWLIAKIGPLGFPGPQTEQDAARYVKTGRLDQNPWPFRKDARVDEFRREFGRFARDCAPHMVRSDKWLPSRRTTREVLRRLCYVLDWATRAREVSFFFGEVELSLGKDRYGRPVVKLYYDDAFLILWAFVELAKRFIGRFRTCVCEKPFLADGKRLFHSPACSARERQRRRRVRIVDTGILRQRSKAANPRGSKPKKVS